MKKLQSLGRSLSKAEQKKIMGGDYGDGGGTVYGWCTQHVGCWSTTSSLEVCNADIPNNCRGGGVCSTTNGCPW